jgi:hypothetical protein
MATTFVFSKRTILFVSISAILLSLQINTALLTQQAYAQPSVTIRQIQCGLIRVGQIGVIVGFDVAGVSHDSHTLDYPVDIFAPSGNPVINLVFSIPSNAPDPASPVASTNFPVSPSTPAPGA